MKNSYDKHLTIEEELKWYEKKIKQIESYLDGIEPESLMDRKGLKEGAKGGAYQVVVATIEQQMASFMTSMEKLPKLYYQLDELRNKYKEKEFMARGNVEIKNTGLDFAKKFAKEEIIE